MALSPTIPGLYVGILTFLSKNLIGGNGACIGYQFAILEMKVFLDVLLRDLEVGSLSIVGLLHTQAGHESLLYIISTLLMRNVFKDNM